MEKIKQALGLAKLKLSVNDWLLLLLPIAVWFSYHPLMELGQSDTMYFEASISLIVLALFAVTALPWLWQARREIGRRKSSWLVVGFAVWNLASVAWSENQLRGLLTAGVVGLLALAFLRITTHPKIKQLLPALFKLSVGTAVVVSIFAWVQMILDMAGVPMETSLICMGCQFEYFGFPRAVGFAIEPQFLGSLLLAPILALVALAYKSKPRLWRYALIGFLLLTLFMTLSRGAIYALAVGLVALLVINFRRIKQNLLVVGLATVCLAASLLAQGSMVALNPSVGESFSAGVAKSLHHLSLGTIDLRQQAKQVEPDFLPPDEVVTEKPTDAYFDGYVVESTKARLDFNELAFNAWKTSPATMIFGVGLGGAGVAMHQTHPDQVGQLEITQNEYTEIPLELGLIGLAIFALLLVGFFYKTSPQKWVWALALAFLAQWIFFSGYPNATHIYLVLFLLLTLPEEKLKKPQ